LSTISFRVLDFISTMTSYKKDDYSDFSVFLGSFEESFLEVSDFSVFLGL